MEHRKVHLISERDCGENFAVLCPGVVCTVDFDTVDENNITDGCKLDPGAALFCNHMLVGRNKTRFGFVTIIFLDLSEPDIDLFSVSVKRNYELYH